MKNIEENLKDSIYYPSEFKLVKRKGIFGKIGENLKKIKNKILGKEEQKLLPEKTQNDQSA